MADDEPTRVPLLAVVYKTQTQTLGAAYLEDGTTLRYCEVADTEFHMLRSLKFELNPDLIIAPANADAVWLAQLGSSSRGADAETLLDDADPAVDEADPDGEAGTIPVQLGKSRDFSASSAAKRLVLLMHGRAQDDDQLQLTERESLIRLEHQLPREQEQAWRAVGGLLAHLQKEDAGQLSISTLAPHALDKVMRIAPEVLLSLNIFVDRHHPSVHGGKSRDAFSLWSLFNNTSSKPGEKLLRSWFARPSLDLEVLSQRQESIAFVISRQELLPQWKTLAKKIKDVRGLRASFDRGGLLLADYKAALSTAACAIHMRDMLLAAEASAERLHVMARLASVGSTELAELSNMIFGIVDFEASGRKDERAAKHICVKENVHPQLDDLRQSCAGMQNVLTSTAQEERARLERHSLMPQYALDDQLYVVFITQLGFMLKMPMPEVRPEEAEYVERDFEAAGLALQFHEEGEGFFKTAKCASLDDKYGDILSRMRDLESHLVRHLELQVLASLSELLDAQSVLAELDCILALATAAIEHKLVRPRVVDGAQLDLKGAWHPLLHAAQQLVPNDCRLCAPGEPEAADRMLLLTGPNASGKTVYLRMVGITCFLAHIGSFVPAESATVGLTDAIFTRMVSRESTLANASAFMADLTQMSNMMRHSTRRSLCLVDEFGKGTNAQDGISFLYACLRHFLDRGRECPRLLACTHYTELLELPELVDRPGLSLWTMQVMLEKKTEADDTLDDVIFLYRAIPGRSEGSFAYHCAAAANVPRAVIDRAVQVSRLRDAGEPVHAMDRSESDAASERRRLAARDELLSGFLEFDFRTRRAGEFYVAHAACVDTLRQPATARAGGAFC